MQGCVREFEPKRKMLSVIDTKMEKGKQVKKVFHKHVRAMFTMSPDIITKDYTDSAVLSFQAKNPLI